MLSCRYELDGREFTERITVPGQGSGARWHTEAARAAARLVFLLAGVSYYKTAAPGVLDLTDLPTTPAERAFLRAFYLEGLGEFAYRNGLDLSGLVVEGPDAPDGAPVEWAPDRGRPL
ncbi:MAG: endonuclease domain-containing protein, partial [Gemmatimonadales bacterium]